MPTTLNVAKADLSLESAFVQPEFSLFRDTPALLRQLFTHLQSHSPQLQNMKIERGNDSIGDFHVVCQLYEFRVGVRIYAEKVAVICLNVLDNEIGKFGGLVVSALSAVKAHQPTAAFRTHTMSVAMHGKLDDKSASAYLSTFAGNVPTGLGPQTGNGGVAYFGPKDDRIVSSLTFDISALLPDGMFIRPYVVWDASKVEVSALPARAMTFVREALNALGLEVPTLK